MEYYVHQKRVGIYPTCRVLFQNVSEGPVDRFPKREAEPVRLGSNHMFGFHRRQPQRKFDAGRLRKQFQQLVGFMTIIKERVLTNSEFGTNKSFIDSRMGSAVIVLVEKPSIDLFNAYDTIVAIGTFVILFHNCRSFKPDYMILTYFTHFSIHGILYKYLIIHQQ